MRPFAHQNPALNEAAHNLFYKERVSAGAVENPAA
jgi:hypothetical protein